MTGDEFAEFERAGWERAAPRYEECWTDTVLFVEALLDAAAVGAGSRLLGVACTSAARIRRRLCHGRVAGVGERLTTLDRRPGAW
jgi:hypothetical protein